MIKTVGDLRLALVDVEADVEVAIDDADEGKLLRITECSIIDGVLVIGGDYNHRRTEKQEQEQ